MKHGVHEWHCCRTHIMLLVLSLGGNYHICRLTECGSSHLTRNNLIELIHAELRDLECS